MQTILPKKCPLCGNSVSVDVKGHFETLKCLNCDWILQSTIVPSDEVSGIDNALSDHDVDLFLDVSDVHTRNLHIINARILFDALGRVPMNKLVSMIDSNNLLPLGSFSMSNAVEKMQVADSKGLRVIKRERPRPV